jgi:hypothetical protein
MLHTFKTAGFAKAAKKARLTDSALCEAIQQARKGQAVDLGGGVFKKRLGNNAYRSLILAKCGKRWVFEYLFAKNVRDNISMSELEDLRQLAKTYAALTEAQVSELLTQGFFTEICHDQDPIQI